MLFYDINTETNLIRTTAEGKITLRDLRLHMERVINDERFREGMHTLVDLENAHVDISLEELPALKGILKAQEAARKKGKWAVLTSKGTIKLIYDMAIATLPLKSIRLRVFNDEEDAARWIAEDVP